MKDNRHTNRPSVPSLVVLLLPWAVVYGAFFVFPFIFSFVLAFLHYNPLSVHATSWAGLENFIRLFGDERFLRALRNTLLFVVGTVPLTTAAALGLALLLRGRVPAKSAFKAGFFLPSIMSAVVISLLFKLFYAPNGGLNHALSLVGVAGHGWLTDPSTALAGIMVMDVWAAVGYYAIIFDAAFAGIPKEFYEAASLEGAGFRDTLRYVTVPALGPVITFVLVINTIRSFQIFIEVFVMTQGGPLGSTDTLVLYVYEAAFRNLDYGYASALAYAVFVLSGVFSIVAMKRFRPRLGSAGGS